MRAARWCAAPAREVLESVRMAEARRPVRPTEIREDAFMDVLTMEAASPLASETLETG
jgi:hypothetical protein